MKRLENAWKQKKNLFGVLCDLKLFVHTITPMLTYFSEILGFNSISMITKVQTDFSQKICETKERTPNYIFYSELGRYSL